MSNYFRNKKKFIFLLIFFFFQYLNALDYQSSISNKRLILKGSKYAGFKFINTNELVGFAELTKNVPVYKADLQWISDNIILVTESGKVRKNAPPRNWVYEIIKVTDHKIILKQYWTGWNKYPAKFHEYIIGS